MRIKKDGSPANLNDGNNNEFLRMKSAPLDTKEFSKYTH